MQAKEMKLNTDYQVVMHNDLIKSKSNLALNEIKLLRLAIAQLCKEDESFREYQVALVDLAKTLNISRQSLHEEVDKITTALLREVVVVGDGNPKHKWKKFQWVSSCRYEDGILTIRLHDDLKPYLLQLSKLYTQYFLDDVLQFKTAYAIRMYELIEEELKGRKVYSSVCESVVLDIKTIKTATNTEEKYPQYGMWKKRVLESALNEINKKSRYHIDFTERKVGRKVVGFKLDITTRIYAELMENRRKVFEDLCEKKSQK